MASKKKTVETSRVSETSRSSKIKKNSSQTQAFTCPICLDPIKDTSEDSTGEDAIVCEGRCNTWLHRKCAGLSKAAYDAATSSSASFYCPHCRLDTQESEIASLKCTIQQLVEDVYSLGNRLLPTTDADTIQSSSVNPSRMPWITYSQVLKSPAGPTLTTSSQISCQISSQTPLHKQESGLSNHISPLSKPKGLSSSKYNIVVHGISERPKGTPRHKRLNKAFCEVNDVLQKLVSNAQVKPGVRDCRWIGKYDE